MTEQLKITIYCTGAVAATSNHGLYSFFMKPLGRAPLGATRLGSWVRTFVFSRASPALTAFYVELPGSGEARCPADGLDSVVGTLFHLFLNFHLAIRDVNHTIKHPSEPTSDVVHV